MILCEGIPDTLSVLAAGLRDTGACGLYGTGCWHPSWLPLFRRAGRVYVALDRDATDRAIVLAGLFGTRGRVLIPPEELGPKGDLNDWLRMGAKGDPAVFRSILERALAMSQAYRQSCNRAHRLSFGTKRCPTTLRVDGMPNRGRVFLDRQMPVQ